jgi:hypothetical protein
MVFHLPGRSLYKYVFPLQRKHQHQLYLEHEGLGLDCEDEMKHHLDFSLVVSRCSR